MPGLMAFHAHPDDEVLGTGLTLARYADGGEQVVVVTATDGSEGEIHNYDRPAELRPHLAELRAEELASALEVLGVVHHEFLGYRDSGMMGTEPNHHPDCFWQADFTEATGRLIRLIRRYRPEVLVTYEPFGGYGHPDHIQVHRVGTAAFFGLTDESRFPLAAGEEPWTPSKLYWVVWPRARVQAFVEYRRQAGLIGDEEAARMASGGTPDADVTTWIEYPGHYERKERALAAHRSQLPADWLLLQIPVELREQFLGREAFVRVFSRVPVPDREEDLFAGLR